MWKKNQSISLTLTESEQLADISKKSITIKELELEMDSETEGTAKILITVPDYKKLFQEALKTKNPEDYIRNVLNSGKYDVVEYEEFAPVTMENGEKTIHSDEAVQKSLEMSLIDAINVLSEVKHEKDY